MAEIVGSRLQNIIITQYFYKHDAIERVEFVDPTWNKFQYDFHISVYSVRVQGAKPKYSLVPNPRKDFEPQENIFFFHDATEEELFQYSTVYDFDVHLVQSALRELEKYAPNRESWKDNVLRATIKY